MSKQHILPDRLKSLVPRTKDATLLRSERLIYDTQGRLALTIPSRKLKPGHLGSAKLRVVCIPCNAGWIKDAETAAFKILEPLILGAGAPILSPAEQFAVALMASTIFCMIDLRDKEQTIRPQDRMYIYENRGPPPHWHFFLGRCDTPNWETRYFRHTGISLPKGAVPVAGQKPNSHAITVALGKLVIHTVADQDGPLVTNPIRFANILGLASFPSIATVDTGALPIHGDAGMQRIADDFGTWTPRGRKWSQTKTGA